MTTWVIGDVHGCWRSLQLLLERLRWNPDRDRLWLVGDLVNRGPDSLSVLRWAHHHRQRVTAVLGNHDLHLVARAAGLRRPRRGDTLDEVLAAPDADELIHWLRRRPLLVREDGSVLVHAGFHPSWSTGEAAALALAVGDRLRDPAGLAALYAHRKAVWRDDLEGDERLAAALNVFTRIRVVRPDGRPRLGFTGAPVAAPADTRPWYVAHLAATEGVHVYFGHWAMAGLHHDGFASCLDSGCVWGGRLSAVRLGNRDTVSVPAAAADAVSWQELGDDHG